MEKQPDVAPFVTAFRNARTLWREDRDRIESLLVEHDGWKQNWYPRAEMPAWFLAMDAFLASEDPAASLSFPQLRKFTSEQIASFHQKGL